MMGAKIELVLFYFLKTNYKACFWGMPIFNAITRAKNKLLSVVGSTPRVEIPSRAIQQVFAAVL